MQGDQQPLENTTSPPSGTLSNPSWKELQEFIAKQTERDRDIIDKWFKLAAWIIAAIITVTAVLIGLFGLRSLGDAKHVAEDEAKRAATAKIAELLQTSDDVRKLAKEAAENLLQRDVTQLVKTGSMPGLIGPPQFQTDRRSGDEDVTITFVRVVSGQILIATASGLSASNGDRERKSVGVLAVRVNNDQKPCAVASTSINSAAGNDQELFTSAGCIWKAEHDYDKVTVLAHYVTYFDNKSQKYTQLAALLMPVTAVKP